MDALILDEPDVLRMADVTAVDLTVPRWRPRYRVLPLDDVLAVIQDRTRRLGRMRWGWQRGDPASRTGSRAWTSTSFGQRRSTRGIPATCRTC